MSIIAAQLTTLSNLYFKKILFSFYNYLDLNYNQIYFSYSKIT